MKNLWSIIGSFVVGLFLGSFAAITLIREAVPLRDHIFVTLTFVVSFIPILIVLWFWFIHINKSLKGSIGEKGGKIFMQLIVFLLVAEVILFVFIAGFYFTAIA